VDRCFALITLSVALRLQGHISEALLHADAACALAEASSSDELARLDPQQFRAMCLMDAGRLDDVAASVAAGRSSAEALGLAWNLPGYHYLEAHRRFLIGDWDDALAELEAGLVLDADVGSPDLPGALAFHAQLAVLRGDPGRAEADLAASDDARAAAGSLMGSDQAIAARAALAEVTGTQSDLGLDDLWSLLHSMGIAGNRVFFAADLVRAQLQAGERARATTIAEQASALAAAAGSQLYDAVAAHCSALLSGGAPELLDAARGLGAAGLRVHEASALEDVGVALGATDRDGARAHLDEALRFHESVGAVRDAARVHAHMRSLGIRKGTRGPRQRPTTGWASLTPTELAVVELITEGLTTVEVAHRLYVSRHTVATHVKHVFSKLGISSRVELAAIAAPRLSSRAAPDR
jgi:DNA-binding CsgD family transcriptional regulator